MRSRLLAVGTLLTVVVLCVEGVLGQEESAPGRWQMEKGDVALLARIATDSGVATRPSRSGAMDYVVAVVERILRWAVGLLKPLGRYAESMGSFLEVATRLLTILALALILYLSGRWLARRRRRSPGEADVLVEQAVAATRSPWDGADWRRELQKRLDRSDVPGSLEALWWWLARSVEGASVDDSWTIGDLLARARRPGLRTPVRTLERMMYGSRMPSVNEVRVLLGALEQQLA